MTSERALLEDVVDDLLGAHCRQELVAAAEEGEWPAELWERMEELGLTLASVAEEAGGAGGSLADACAVVRVAARHAAPLPLGETGLLAGWLLERAGLPVPRGPLTVAAGDGVRIGADGALEGTADAVPWGERAAAIVVLADDPDGLVVAAVAPAACTIEPGRNVAGEPRDRVRFAGAPAGVAAAPPDVDRASLRRRGALTRAVQLLGAMEHVLDLTAGYVSEREQFGRPLARFQVIQHDLAALAREVAVARAAVSLAVGAPDGALESAVAKVVCGRAVRTVAPLAHQLHGALGVTREYSLQLFTRRLWAWRDEYGSEMEWARELGERALAAGDLWGLITSARLPAPEGD